MVMKANHCFTDGLGMGAFCLALSDNYDASNLPRIVPLHWAFECLMIIMSPLLLLKGTWNVPAKNVHYFKQNSDAVSGIKKGAFSMDLDISQIKQICKER